MSADNIAMSSPTTAPPLTFSATAAAALEMSSYAPRPSAGTSHPREDTQAGISGTNSNPLHHIRLVPHFPSLPFDAIGQDLREGDTPLYIGRFTDRSSKLTFQFKSKVVSRTHAKIWVEKGGRVFVKDNKSSAGTFLNDIRLSPANTESMPHQIHNGDILQLGVDYQGGTEDLDIYKSVRMKVELTREWQASASANIKPKL